MATWAVLAGQLRTIDMLYEPVRCSLASPLSPCVLANTKWDLFLLSSLFKSRFKLVAASLTL
jgi:hypothetical protein